MAKELSIRITADNSQAHDALSQTETDIRGVESTASDLDRSTRTFGQRMREAYETPGGLTNLGKNLQALGGETRRLGTALTVGVTAPLAAIGYWAQDAGMGLIQTLNQIEAVTGATSDQMIRMRDAAQEWGQKTVFSSADAADALLQLSKAGLSADQAIGALPATLQLAVAAELSMGEAARATANTLAVFKLGVEDMSSANDILVAAANASTMDVAHLTQALKFVGPVAAAAQTPLQDIAAAAAVLADNGIRADMAGTGLRGMLTKLIAPTKATRAALDVLGFQQEVAAGQTVAWTDMLDALKVQLDQGGATADYFTGQIMKGFGQRAGPTVLALAQQGGDAIKELSAEFLGATGTAERMTDAMMKGLPGAVEELRGSMETMGASLLMSLEQPLSSIVSLMGSVAEFVTGRVLPAFDALPSPVKTVGVATVGLFVALGPLVHVLGGLISMIGSLLPSLPALVAGFGLLTSPIGLVVAAVAALGVAWAVWGDDVMATVASVYASVKSWLWDKFEPVLRPLIPLLESIGAMFSAFGDLVVAVGSKIIDLFIVRVKAQWELMTSVLSSTIEAIKGWVGSIPDALLPLLGPIGLVIAAFRNWDQISAIARAAYEGVKTWLLDRFTSVVDAIRGKVDAVTGFFRDMYDKVVGNSYVPDMMLRIQSEFAKLPSIMVAPAQTAISTVETKFSEMTDGITNTLSSWGSSLGSSIQSMVGGPIGSAFGSIATSVLNSVGTILTGGMNQLIQIGMQFAMEGLKKIGGMVWDGLKSIGSAIGGFFGGLFGGGNDTKKARDQFAGQMGFGSIDGLFDELRGLGRDDLAHQALNVIGKKDSAANQAWMQEVMGLLNGIPDMAMGGVVMPQPGGSIVRVAEAGKPEAIVPLEEWQPPSRSATQVSITVHAEGAMFTDELSMTRLADQIARRLPYRLQLAGY